MGTNYYWFEKPPCKECERPHARLHVGKSSAGWCFSLHVAATSYDAEYTGLPRDLDGWKKLFDKPGSYIENEDGERISVEEMLGTITKRSGRAPVTDESAKQMGYLSADHFYRSNHARPGPGNLLRHESKFCVGHGEGTWDLIAGDFS